MKELNEKLEGLNKRLERVEKEIKQLREEGKECFTGDLLSERQDLVRKIYTLEEAKKVLLEM